MSLASWFFQGGLRLWSTLYTYLCLLCANAAKKWGELFMLLRGNKRFPFDFSRKYLFIRNPLILKLNYEWSNFKGIYITWFPFTQYRGSPTYAKITNAVPYFHDFGLCMRKWGIFVLVGDLLQYIPFKIFSATSASNGSLIKWKIALFHKKNILADRRTAWTINDVLGL